MATGSYDLQDWESDAVFLGRYVYPSESGHIPPDYLREIKAYFQEYHAENAEFRSERVSSMLAFLVANISSFNVGGLAMITSEAVNISPSLWFALWTFFGAPSNDTFNPNPDPQDVLAFAEDAEADGLFE